MDENTEPAADPSAPIVAARALVAPVTVDRAARTVEVVWSTGARARNFVAPYGAITEELDMSPEAVRMDALQSGRAPVLNTHRRGDARDVLGTVTAARIEGGRGYATLQFSTAPDVEPIWQRVADGTLRSVSVGYEVKRYRQIPGNSPGETIHRAVDWRPYEISVVAVPVDAAAGMRGATGDPQAIGIEPDISMKDTTMAETPQGDQPTDTPAAPAGSNADANRGAASDANRNQQDPILAERARIEGLHAAAQAARALSIPAETVEATRARAVAENWTADALRARLFEVMLNAPRPNTVPSHPTQGGPSRDDPAAIREAMAEAIAARSMGADFKPSSDRHREFLGWRPSDMISEMLRVNGERNIPRSTSLLAERAFHTTSDFPLLLSAAANKMLLAAYQPAMPTYREVFVRKDFRDFKPHRHLRIGDFPTLLPLLENGEIQVGTVSESQEQIALTTFARRLRVTRQMLVNDDLGAFTDFASMIGRRIADFENATAYGLVNTASGSGPTLTTNNAAVFSTAATRKNQAAAGTALDLTNLAAGRSAVMQQKTLDGLPISVGNQMRLLVGPAQELAARQITVNVAATQTSNANVYAGFIQPIVEPLIPSNRWYLFADPKAAPVYAYGYLNGAEGPQVTTGPVSGVDGVEVAVIFDFGVGAIDWRGAWFNPGT